MNNNTLIDDHSLDIDFYEEVQQKNKTYVRWVLFSMLFIAILYPLAMVDDNPSIGVRIRDAFIYILVVIPLFTTILSVPVTFFPYKNLTWTQKYLRAFLLTFLFFNIAFLLLISFIGCYTFYDYMIV